MKTVHTILLMCLCFWASNTMLAQEFYSDGSINKVEITFAEDDWQLILEELKAEGKDRLKANMVLNGKKYSGVGVRYKGNSSYNNIKNKGLEKLPFNIKVDYTVKDQKIEGLYDRVKLSNVFADPSFVREVLAYEIAQTYTFAPKANFAQLYINGEYFGLYTNTQSIDNTFLNEHFGEEDGPFFKCDKVDQPPAIPSNCGKSYFSSLKYIGPDSACYAKNYELKSEYGWAVFIEMCKVLNTNISEIETVLDVDKVLWMHAFNMILVNLDSYSGRLSHNYYMYQNKSGQFVPLIWDLNLAFGAFKFAGKGGKLSNDDIIELSVFTHYKEKNPNFPLITNLLAIPKYRKIYLDHIYTILQEYFVSGLYYERAKELNKLVYESVESDDMKLYSFESYKTNLDSAVYVQDFGLVLGIKELMEQRTAYLLSKPYFKQDRPIITKPKVYSHNGLKRFTISAKDATECFLVYRDSSAEPFIHYDMSAESESFFIDLDAKKGGEYYFIADNGKALTHLPLRASYEFFTIE